MRRLILAACALLLLAMGIVSWHTGLKPRPVGITPALTGQPEYCLTCHEGLAEISPSHPVETFGCVLCHGGERLAQEAGLAHSTMRGGRNPSDLSVVEASCGGSSCHSGEAAGERDHIQRVMTSIQTTYAGAIANIRFTFGAQPNLDALSGITAVQETSTLRRPIGEQAANPFKLEAFDPSLESHPSVQAFAANCLYCHIYAEPPGFEQPPAAPATSALLDQPGLEYARLTGCAACHTPTSGKDLAKENQAARPVHQLTTAIPYTQCNTCHNRGNYDLRDLQFHPRQDQPADRLNDYYQPISQFTRCEVELDCIDCHTRQEAMGDGHIYNNQKEIQYVQCRTCHGTLEALPRTRTIETGGHIEDIALRLAFLNPVVDLKIGDTIAITDQDEPIWNMLQVEDGKFEMVAKVTGLRYTVPLVMGSACQQKPDEQESRFCHACHAVER